VQESNNPNPDHWLQSLSPFGAGMAAHSAHLCDGARPVLETLLNGDNMTILAKYVWEGNRYYDPLVLGYEGSGWRDPLCDGLGSTRQLATYSPPNWSVTDTYSYEAFGNLLSSTGTTPNPYPYVGSLGYYQTCAPQ